MKKQSFFLVLLLMCTTIMSFTSVPQAKGVLYIKLNSDGNSGAIHVTVKDASANLTLMDVQLLPGQNIEKTFTNLTTGPLKCYIFSFDWPKTDYHNMNSENNIIAWGLPVTALNSVVFWQVGGMGAFGSIPVILPQILL